MNEMVGPQPNTNYLKSAISQIYGDEDDFIVIGLTGRTGSGCSTAAKILCSEKTEIKHSLFNGDKLETNQQRKERILFRNFQEKWTPFLLVQVRSIITTFLLDGEIQDITQKYNELISDKKLGFIEILISLQKDYKEIKGDEDRLGATNYFTKILPEKCDALRTLLGESVFVKLYQIIGSNIRISGDPCNNILIEDKFFTLADRINYVIKRIHKERREQKKQAFIVVDSIRNPLEAIFFQDRYASFFLLAISTPELHRLERLRSIGYSSDDITSIDRIEYKKRSLEKTEFYSVQDIQKCLQRSDLYINNPNEHKTNQFQDLANQLIKFVCLARYPGIITPSSLERCMQVAYTAKLNSGCISRQVGAVVTDKNFSIRSIGWNDVPYGQIPCNLRSRGDLLHGRDSEAYSDFERDNEEYLIYFKKSSQRYSSIPQGRCDAFCFKSEYNHFKGHNNQVHTRSIHAEENAFLQIAKYGLGSIENGILFTTASPCELCAKKAYQLGIKKIYYIDPYPGIALTHILQSGAKRPELILFSGAIGRAFHKLYMPIVAYKDELNALTQ